MVRVKYQNVTLAIPKAILQQAKRMAMERGTSLSGMLTQLLIEYTLEDKEYRKARRNHTAMMGKLDLGTEGNMVVSRESLYAR